MSYCSVNCIFFKNGQCQLTTMANASNSVESCIYFRPKNKQDGTVLENYKDIY